MKRFVGQTPADSISSPFLWGYTCKFKIKNEIKKKLLDKIVSFSVIKFFFIDIYSQ